MDTYKKDGQIDAIHFYRLVTILYIQDMETALK